MIRFFRFSLFKKSGNFPRLHAVVVAAMLGIFVPVLQAQQVTKLNLSVDRIFTEGVSHGGFFPTQDISADCLWGLIYFDLSNQTGRGHLALLLQAKALGLKVNMVSAIKGAPGYAPGTCLAQAIHIQ